MALIKAHMAAMLLLALVVATAAAADQHAAGGGGTTAKGGSGHRAPLTGLTQCVTACGTTVTSCFLKCYQPLADGDPAMLPICLLGCTNAAMLCANNCSADII